MRQCTVRLFAFIAYALPSVSFAAPVESLLYSFAQSEINAPQGKLFGDTHGLLYGTASTGGAGSVGGIFELVPPAGSATTWTSQVLYQFGQSSSDGANPISGLIADTAGNLYGTTAYGGPGDTGTVYRLSPPADAAESWSETQLYSFQGGDDGCEPLGGLVADAVGNLYGTTQGCKSGVGTVFELMHPAAGEATWKEIVLHDFSGKNDGRGPASTLIVDGNGNLFGTAGGGGSGSAGIVFELSPPASGTTKWRETILHRFVSAAGGKNPSGSLVMDASHSLYGNAGLGGAGGYGLVYKLVPPDGLRVHWVEVVLYSFKGGSDGGIPTGALVFDKSGNLYGTSINNFGNVFELIKPATHMNKLWSELVLHTFTNDANGTNPVGGLLADEVGDLFGVTSNNPGTVYKVAP